MPPEQKRKNRTVKPYEKKSRKGKSISNVPKTSAVQSLKKQNLTLHDWLRVVDFFDSNKMSQEDVVKHFRDLPKDSLLFTQSALQDTLLQRAERMIKKN